MISIKKKDNILVINYEKHINDTYNIWIKVLEYYKIELNKDYLLKAIDINSEENLKKKGFKDFKTITSDNQKELRIEIEKIIKEYFSLKNFRYDEVYENLGA